MVVQTYVVKEAAREGISLLASFISEGEIKLRIS